MENIFMVADDPERRCGWWNWWSWQCRRPSTTTTTTTTPEPTTTAPGKFNF